MTIARYDCLLRSFSALFIPSILLASCLNNLVSEYVSDATGPSQTTPSHHIYGFASSALLFAQLMPVFRPEKCVPLYLHRKKTCP